jgi:hypothetical protein
MSIIAFMFCSNSLHSHSRKNLPTKVQLFVYNSSFVQLFFRGIQWTDNMIEKNQHAGENIAFLQWRGIWGEKPLKKGTIGTLGTLWRKTGRKGQLGKPKEKRRLWTGAA